MTDEDLLDMRQRVEAAVRAQMEREFTEKRASAIAKEFDAVLREVTRVVISKQRAELERRVEAWMAANVDRLVEIVAKQTIEEALGDVKRRVLGRSAR